MLASDFLLNRECCGAREWMILSKSAPIGPLVLLLYGLDYLECLAMVEHSGALLDRMDDFCMNQNGRERNESSS